MALSPWLRELSAALSMLETPPPPVLLSSPTHPSSLSLRLRNPRQCLIAECKGCCWANELSNRAETPLRSLGETDPCGVRYHRSRARRVEFRWSRAKEFTHSGTVESVREYTTGNSRSKRWRKRGQRERGGEETGNTQPEREREKACSSKWDRTARRER